MENPEDERKWEIEANAVINDIRNHVCEVFIASSLPNSLSGIYFNVETVEKKRFCVKLAGNGFQIVGYQFDQSDLEDGMCFETPQSLMSSISPGFVNSFGQELSNKLAELLNQQH